MAYRETLRFEDKYLEDSRKFMVTQNQLEFLYKFIGLKNGMIVADLGCGTGFFTRQIAKLLKNTGKVMGIDINPKLIKCAKLISQSESLINTDFIQANALNLQFPENSFDLTTCHFLLSRLPNSEPKSVIKEMIRVTKPGGRITAIEPCLGGMSAIYSSNFQLSVLLTKIRKVKTFIQQQFMGIDENIGIKLPEIFSEMNLISIETEIMAFSWWTPQPFNKSEIEIETKEWYLRRRKALSEPENVEIITNYGKLEDAASVLRNVNISDDNTSVLVDQYEKLGITPHDFQKLRDMRIEYIDSILDDKYPGKFVNDIELIPVFAITSIKKRVE